PFRSRTRAAIHKEKTGSSRPRSALAAHPPETAGATIATRERAERRASEGPDSAASALLPNRQGRRETALGSVVERGRLPQRATTRSRARRSSAGSAETEMSG